MDIIKWVTEWATDPWGQNVPMHIAWFLIWVGDRGAALPRRARHLRAVFRPSEGVCRRCCARRRGPRARAHPQTLAGRAAVSLDYGSRHVHAAADRLPAEGRAPV